MLLSFARFYRPVASKQLALGGPLLQGRSAASSMPDEVKRVAAAEAQELLSSGRYTYLDVRTPEEFAAGHAVGAVNVPLMLKTDAGMVANPDFLKQVKASFPDTEQQLVVGCKAGNRSLRACAALSEDYPNLVDNAGGFDGWLAAKLPVAT